MAAPTVTASGTASVTICAANPARSKLIVENTDANRLYVLLDSGTASATNFTFSLAQNERYVVSGYTDTVKGLWAGDGAGAAYATEY